MFVTVLHAYFLCTQSTFAIDDPRSIPGNVLWLDGSDVDGDFLIGGAFRDGTTWVDKSSTGNAHAVQTAANRIPSTEVCSHHGLATLSFDGTDYMDVASEAFGMLRNTSGCTLFVLASATQATGTQGHRVFMISTGTNSAGTRAGFNFHDSFGTSIGGSGIAGLAGRRLDSDPYQRINGFGLVDGSYGQWTGVFDYQNGKLDLFADGVLSTSAAGFQSAGNTSETDSLNIRLGADAALNADRGFFTGNLAELIVYDRVLTESERRQAESYLVEKWNIPKIRQEVTGGNLVLSWPSSAPYWRAEESQDLVNFDPTSFSVIEENGRNKVNVPLTVGRSFYRLVRP